MSPSFVQAYRGHSNKFTCLSFHQLFGHANYIHGFIVTQCFIDIFLRGKLLFIEVCEKPCKGTTQF